MSLRHLAVIAALLGIPQFVPASDPAAGDRSFEFADEGPRQLLIGKWKPTAQQGNTESVIEFTRGGKLKMTAEQFNIDGSYKFIDDHHLELNIKFGNDSQSVKLTVTVTRNELITQEANSPRKEIFKRVR